MKEWWNGLQPRERQVLGGGALVLALLALYALVWEPYSSETERLQQRVAEQRELVAWMEQAAAEVQTLRGGGTERVASGQSLLALVDSTGKAQGLGEAMKRIQPDGGQGVRVWLEQAPFDKLLRWVDLLTGKYGVRLEGLVVERGEAPGIANVRAVLGTPQ